MKALPAPSRPFGRPLRLSRHRLVSAITGRSVNEQNLRPVRRALPIHRRPIANRLWISLTARGFT